MTSTIPVVPTAAIGGQISAAWWNTSAAPPISWLLDPDKCDIYDNTGNSIPNAGSGTLLVYDTEATDTQGMHVAGSGRVTYFAPGRWTLKIFVTMPGSATYTQLDVNIRKNSGGSSSGGTSLRTFPMGAPSGSAREVALAMDYVFASGDYTEIFVAQTSGATRITTASGLYCTGFQARWVSLT